MCVRVVDVRGLNKAAQRAGVCYVGRAFAGWPRHPLCNPHRPTKFVSLDECLREYRAHLEKWIDDLDGALAALWDECEQGKKPLGCWCVNATAGDGSPVVCHAQILAEMLWERFCSEQA